MKSTDVVPEIDWYLLHEIRLRGAIEPSDHSGVEGLLASGYITVRGSAVAITEEGRAVHRGWAALPPGTDEHDTARRAYDRFGQLDPLVKQVITEWQLKRAGAASAGYGEDEWALIDRLIILDEKAAALLNALGRAIPRFASYRPRMRLALQRLEEGEPTFFCGLTCDSYHTVWWQLHEDLLLAVGLDRSQEPNQ